MKDTIVLEGILWKDGTGLVVENRGKGDRTKAIHEAPASDTLQELYGRHVRVCDDRGNGSAELVITDIGRCVSFAYVGNQWQATKPRGEPRVYIPENMGC